VSVETSKARLPTPLSTRREASTQAPALGRREQQRLATRERIYATAIAEFERAGFAAAQIDRIVEQAGVARGTFYFHFPSKEHVLVELQHRIQDEFVPKLAEMGPPSRSVAEFFHQVYDLFAASRREHPQLMREILAMYARQDMGMVLTDEALILYVVDYLSDAAERGVVRKDIPPEQLAIHFLSGMFVHFIGGPDNEREDETARAKIEILARGMEP